MKYHIRHAIGGVRIGIEQLSLSISKRARGGEVKEVLEGMEIFARTLRISLSSFGEREFISIVITLTK